MTGISRGGRHWLRVVALVIGVLGVVAALIGLVVRTFGLDWQPAIVAASFWPALLLAGLVGVVLLAVVRWWPGAAVGLVVVALGVAGQVPSFVGASPGDGVPLTVLQANLMVGSADAGELVRQVRDHRVALLTVDELTADALTRLTAAGLDDLLPHRLVVTFPGGAGTGIWSATPLENPEKIEDYAFELLGATITPAGAAPVHVVAVHLLPPWPYPAGTWTAELRRLHDRLRGLTGTAVASGDFNATLDHPQFRALLTGGFHDAAEHTGSGWQPTYPTDKPGPPFLTLDHVVSRGAEAARTRTVDLPGSDHRGLLVDLRLPRA